MATPAEADVAADEVHYTFLNGTSVALDWRGTAQDVQFGRTTTYDQSTTGHAPSWTPWSSAGPFWQTEITGLAPGTTYHYSIGGGPDWTFHTPPTTTYRFDAIGDVGDTGNFSKLADTFSAIASDQPSFVLMVGDLSYGNASGQSAVDQHFNDVMSWSTSAAYIPAWGNHEWETPSVDDLRNYKGRLLMPNAQTSPGSPPVSAGGNDWGWFDAGPVRFIDYPEPWTGALDDWRTHAADLMSQAQADPSISYIVTYGHRPAYSSGYHPGESTLAGILGSLGASYSKYVLNINGHSHDYERFQPISGVTHVTVGAPSSLETPWSSTDPRTALRAMHLSHMRVDVGGDGLRLQAVCDDASSKDDTTCAPGSILDSWTIGTPPPSSGSTAVYVDKSNSACSDTGPGSAGVPYCTIVKGTSRLLPGQTLYIGNGSYSETVTVPSGTATAPITVTAMPDTSPQVGVGKTNGIYLSGKSNVTVYGLTVSHTSGDGIYLTGCKNVTISHNHVSYSGNPTSTGVMKGIKVVSTTGSSIDGNTVDHNTDSGIYLITGSTGNVIRGNTVFANARQYVRAAPGIDLRSGGNTVIGNVSHDNEDSGVQLYTGSDGSIVAGNVIYHNGDHGVDDFQAPNQTIVGNSIYNNGTAGINLEGGSTGGRVENNVAVDNGVQSVRTVGNIRVDGASQSGTSVDYNLVHQHATNAQYVWGSTNYATLAAFKSATGQEGHGLQGDPWWADPDNGDFRLTAGSPAIDSGDSGAPSEPTTDLLGSNRLDDSAVTDTGAGTVSFTDRGALEAQDGTEADSSPRPALSLSATSGTAPVTLTADASASTDTDASPIARYSFDFGDGTVTGWQSDATATHTYTTTGTHVVRMSVADTAGLTSTTTAQVVVGAPGNVVGNSTFESALTGWVAGESTCVLTRTPTGRDGGYTADLGNRAGAASTCTVNDSPNWVTKTVKGTYTANAWVRSDTPGGQVKLRLREYVGATLVGTGTATINTPPDWTQVTLAYPIASPGSTLDLNVYETSQPTGSDLMLDDVTVTAG